MRQKINLITLGVDNLERAVNFYENALGWKRSPASKEQYILFQLGGIVLGLYSRKELAEDANLADPACTFSGISISHNAFSEAEVNEVLQQAAQYGGSIVKPAQKASWGGYSGYFKDPDGHLIEVAYNPFWPLSADGDLLL